MSPATQALTVLLALTLAAALHAQTFTYDGLAAEALAYEPQRRTGVSEAAFEHGRFLLGEVRRQTGGDAAAFVVADWWNLAVAFRNLGEPVEHLRLAWRRARAHDEADLCDYVASMPRAKLREDLAAEFADLERACAAAPATTRELSAVPAGAEASLVVLLDTLAARDLRYRRGDATDWVADGRAARQRLLDAANLHVVDSLMRVRDGRYPGRDAVGEAREHVVWQVIQHSNPGTMARYLPVLAAAVRDGQLSEGALRMTVDREHALRTGCQVFGTQTGWPLGTVAEREAALERWGLD